MLSTRPSALCQKHTLLEGHVLVPSVTPQAGMASDGVPHKVQRVLQDVIRVVANRNNKAYVSGSNPRAAPAHCWRHSLLVGLKQHCMRQDLKQGESLIACVEGRQSAVSVAACGCWSPPMKSVGAQ
jgi:hypothetical protein